MKRTLAIASSVAMVALAGCSSQIDRKTASGSYEYLKTKEQESLKVPSDLDAPAFSRDFVLPEFIKTTYLFLIFFTSIDTTRA